MLVTCIRFHASLFRKSQCEQLLPLLLLLCENKPQRHQEELWTKASGTSPLWPSGLPSLTPALPNPPPPPYLDPGCPTPPMCVKVQLVHPEVDTSAEHGHITGFILI